MLSSRSKASSRSAFTYPFVRRRFMPSLSMFAPIPLWAIFNIYGQDICIQRLNMPARVSNDPERQLFIRSMR